VGTNHISVTTIVSGAVNLVAGVCHKLLMVVGQLLITPTVEICIQQLGE